MRRVSAVMAMVAAACSSEPPVTGDASVALDAVSADASGALPVELRFAAMVGAAPFSCEPPGGAFANLGSARSPWRPLDFRFYLHDFELVAEGGAAVPLSLDQDGAWQHQRVALLDFESASGTCANGTAATNDRVRGRVRAPAGARWVGLRFKLGVPASLNHQNPAAAASPLNLSTLFWAWQSGYKFLRLDGLSGANAFNIHIGSTGCTGDPMTGGVSCTEGNRPEVTLMGFDPARSVVVADLARLVATTDLSANTGAPGCMSALNDPECRTILPALGISMNGAPTTQTFFSVR